MSYFGYYDYDKGGWEKDESPSNGNYAATPMVLDIVAIQAKYGADYTTRPGDTVYGCNISADLADRPVFDFSKNMIFTIWDGGGNDTLDCSGFANDQIINLTPGSYSSVGGWTDNVAVAYLNNGDKRALIENATGGSGDDSIIGNEASNVLKGGEGKDTLIGGAGADKMYGGAGNDTYVVEDAGDVVSERGWTMLGNWAVSYDLGGEDTIKTSLTQYWLSDDADSVIENLTYTGKEDFVRGVGNSANNKITGGSHKDNLYGLDGKDTLIGGDGDDNLSGGNQNDTLYGGKGSDRMYGGADDDLYSGVDAGDTVIEYAGEGFDTVRTSFSGYTLRDNVEKLIIVNEGPKGAVLVGNGNGLDNVISGDANSEMYGDLGSVTQFHLFGYDGKDTLRGGASDDLLDGGDKDDTLYGYGGKDTLRGGKGADTLFGDGDNDVLTGGADADTFGYFNGWGNDTITDFELGKDVLDMKGVSGLNTLSQLTITSTVEGSARIVFGADSITLKGVSASQLTAASFRFTPPTKIVGTAAQELADRRRCCKRDQGT